MSENHCKTSRFTEGQLRLWFYLATTQFVVLTSLLLIVVSRVGGC